MRNVIAAMAVTLVLLTASAPVYSQQRLLGGDKQDLVNFLRKNASEIDGAISGACLLTERDQNVVRKFFVYVILPRSRASGFVVEMAESSKASRILISNFGFIQLQDGKVQVEDNMGGIWTGEELRRASEAILKQPLYLDFSFERALERAPATECPLPD